jgi:hypothetical protein
MLTPLNGRSQAIPATSSPRTKVPHLFCAKYAENMPAQPMMAPTDSPMPPSDHKVMPIASRPLMERCADVADVVPLRMLDLRTLISVIRSTSNQQPNMETNCFLVIPASRVSVCACLSIFSFS